MRRRWMVLAAMAVVVVVAAGLIGVRLVEGEGEVEPDRVATPDPTGVAPLAFVATALGSGEGAAAWRLSPRRLDAGDVAQSRTASGRDATAAATVAAAIASDSVDAGATTRPEGWAELVGAGGDDSDVVVDHQDGLLLVDLPVDPWRPDVAAGEGSPPGSVLTQQLVWTVQSAVGTTDPVVLTHRGRPVRGVLGHRLSGAVHADPRIALGAPPGDPDRTLRVADAVTVPGDTVTLTLGGAGGALRGTQYELVRVGREVAPEPAAFLTSDWGRARTDRMTASPTPADDGVRIRSAGPDHVVLPEGTTPGPWLLCVRGVGVRGLADGDDPARPRPCAVLHVAPVPPSYAGLDQVPDAEEGGRTPRVVLADGPAPSLYVGLATSTSAGADRQCLVATDVRAAGDTLVVLVADPTPTAGGCPVAPSAGDRYPLSERERSRVRGDLDTVVVLRPDQPATRRPLERAGRESPGPA